MAETANIAQIAEKISQSLFKEFLWDQSGPMNFNWPCEKTEAHNLSTHPTDAVFYYEDPYARARRYFQCDLKSYAKGSISKSAVSGAALSLAKQVACAEVSDVWQDQYIVKGKTSEISGLLFVYNHDREFDRDFKTFFPYISLKGSGISRKSKVYVLGPDEINWLDRVGNTIKIMRGEEKIPLREHCAFHHPDLVQIRNVQQKEARAATIEMLTGPFISMKYAFPALGEGHGNKQGIVLFLRREATVPSMKYMIDYLRNIQIIEDESISIEFRVNEDAGGATNKLHLAIAEYLGRESANSDSSLARRLKSISVERVVEITTSFSELQIGMNYER